MQGRVFAAFQPDWHSVMLLWACCGAGLEELALSLDRFTSLPHEPGCHLVLWGMPSLTSLELLWCQDMQLTAVAMHGLPTTLRRLNLKGSGLPGLPGGDCLSGAGPGPSCTCPLAAPPSCPMVPTGRPCRQRAQCVLECLAAWANTTLHLPGLLGRLPGRPSEPSAWGTASARNTARAHGQHMSSKWPAEV